MKVLNQFEKHFSEENLRRLFSEKIAFSSATGIDNLSSQSFLPQLDEQIDIISRKVLSGTYNFSKYKLKLVSKGRGAAPREISIPTVRDRIVLRALCDFLQERFSDALDFRLPQTVIRDIKKSIHANTYTGVVKLDVSKYYPSINQNLLIKTLRSRIREPIILAAIESAIQSPTVSVSRKSDSIVKGGVPQGLSISNILAAIYLKNVDKYLSSLCNAKAYRYVDDILILCSFEDTNSLSANVIDRFKQRKLKIHKPNNSNGKSSIGNITDGFSYLGYQFVSNKITVRNSSLDKLKNSLCSIFTSYKYSKNKSPNFLRWRLNLRITGCRFDSKNKGWLYFFSEITDESMLHQLDHYIIKLCKRFNVDIEPKKFVRLSLIHI